MKINLEFHRALLLVTILTSVYQKNAKRWFVLGILRYHVMHATILQIIVLVGAVCGYGDADDTGFYVDYGYRRECVREHWGIFMCIVKIIEMAASIFGFSRVRTLLGPRCSLIFANLSFSNCKMIRYVLTITSHYSQLSWLRLFGPASTWLDWINPRSYRSVNIGNRLLVMMVDKMLIFLSKKFYKTAKNVWL